MELSKISEFGPNQKTLRATINVLKTIFKNLTIITINNEKTRSLS